MDRKILLIDGHNLLFQMFYGMPTKIVGHDGLDVRAVVGFIGAVGKMTRLFAPTHIGVIFDGECHNPRCDLLSEYKANRPDFSTVADEDNPFLSLPDIYSALDGIGIYHTESTDCECDDLIAGAVKGFGDGAEVLIASHDSDFFQLIGDNVKVLRYRGDNSVLCDEKFVMDKYGVPPALYADSKALFGDTADNVAGIPGIGPKTAAKLIIGAGGAERLLNNTEAIANARHRQLIEDGRDRIIRNLVLIRLSGDAPLPFTQEQLLWEPRDIRTVALLRQMMIL